VQGSCPLAFAEAFAQAGQGLARLPKSYGEQAGGLASRTVGHDLKRSHYNMAMVQFIGQY